MKNFLINTVIFLLVLVGAFLVIWHYVQEEIMLYFVQVEILPEEFEANLIEAEETATFYFEDVSMLEWTGLLPYINAEVQPIGEIIIPSVDITLPILHGVSDVNMSLGAGTLYADRRMGEGNYVLASHAIPSMPGSLFTSLYQVELGDLLILRDANYLYLYETIIANEVIGAYRYDITYYVEGKVYLTLFTCTPDGSERVFVRGELLEQVSLRDLETLAEMLENLETLEALETLDETALEIVVQVVENLEHTSIPFPIAHVTILIGVPIVLASFVVWISNRGGSKRRKV